MDESALLSALNSFDKSWSVLESWLWVCTSVVVAGVVMEVIVVIWERRHDLRDFWRGTIRSPDKPSTSKFVLELVGSALIALGVLGELIVGIAMGRLETKIRDDTKLVVGIIGDRAEKATLKAAQLETQVADRHVTVEQRKKMIEILASGRGTPISIGYLTDSGADAQGYSLELAEVFCDAGWAVSIPLELIGNNPPTHGFLLDVQPGTSSDSSPPPASQTLASKPPSKKLVASIKEVLAVTGYNTLVQAPSFGFQLGGNAPACKTAPPSASNPAWYPTALELLVGSK